MLKLRRGTGYFVTIGHRRRRAAATAATVATAATAATVARATVATAATAATAATVATAATAAKVATAATAATVARAMVDDGGVGTGRLRALDPPLADGHGYRFVRCGGGGFGRQVSIDAHRQGRPSYLLTVLVGRCTALT